MMTPEMRMKDIFSQIEQLMDSHFQMIAQPSDAMISIKSPLKFKYKPTIKYSIELFRSFEGTVGRLKISFRTQSSQLIDMLDQFFIFWKSVEDRHLAEAFPNGVGWVKSGTTYSRKFYALKGHNLSNEMIANGIGGYVNMIDEAVKMFFDNSGSDKVLSKKIENIYEEYLKDGIYVV